MHQVTLPVCSLLSSFLFHLPTAGVASFLIPLYHCSFFHSSPLSTVPPTACPDPPDRPGPATRPAPGLQSSILPPLSPFLISHLLPFSIFSLLPLTFAFSLCPSTLILFLSSFLCPPPSYHRLLFPSPLFICPSSTSPLPSSGRGCPVQTTGDGGAPGQVLAGSPSLPSSTSPLGEEKTSWPPTLHSATPLSGRSAARTGRSEEWGVGKINDKTSQQN